MEVEIQLLYLSFLILILAMLLIIGNYGKKPVTQNVSGKERRAYPRYDVSLRIKYKTPLEEGISWIKDISEKGARLFLNNTLKAMEIGESLGIEINLPHDPQPILVRGNIVWSREDDAGFEFGSVEEGDINRIIQYINKGEDIARESAYRAPVV